MKARWFNILNPDAGRSIGVVSDKSGNTFNLSDTGRFSYNAPQAEVDYGSDTIRPLNTYTEPSEEVGAAAVATPNNMAAYVANLEQNEQSEIAPNVQLLMDTYGITEAEANNYLGIQNINTA